MPDRIARVKGPRLIALVGPFQSGKTTLLESILVRTGAIARQGSVREGSSIGDASPEARSHAMSVEMNVAATDYLGDRYVFVDCPGSVEFLQDMRATIAACDAAIVVCEADQRKIPALQLILRELEDIGLPRMLFLNKIDQATARVRETLALLQPASRTPLLLRQIPIWQNDIATGFIDLALERAFVYREHAPSAIVDVPAGELPREKEARYSMLERLADYDDSLMEELISDIEPPRDQVFDDLTRELRDGLVVPLMIGSAERGNGVTRLLKALRHEGPGIVETRKRLGVEETGPALAHALRTMHTAHGGKITLARVLRGSFSDNATVIGAHGGEDRIGSIAQLVGASSVKQPRAEAGETVAFGRLDHIATGETFGESKGGRPKRAVAEAKGAEPVHALALHVKDRKDEVKLAAALHKLIEEDPSLAFTQDQASGEMKLAGQGEMHLRVALERLAARFGVAVETVKPLVAWRESIRHGVSVRGRHKKQSGGHGQFGDVALEVRPLDRGAGYQFGESVHGGSVPKQYFSSVEAGCRDACAKGPLGFPVVDVAATLTDGSYHTVDSSDMAFRTAARIGMSEALEKAGPVLLEPVLAVKIHVPSEAMSRATGLATARRGQILGFDGRAGWEGWETLDALIPESEMEGLIVELRSATAGVGSYTAAFDHLAELSGKAADAVVAAHGAHRNGAGQANGH
ncbi:MAG: elongation factor G [Hyphomicrobiales bacterium]|nr:elongation factor G [Hyphomicrobiales bacterium]